MEKTGLEKGGIYRHFASKEELAVAAFDYAWEATKQSRIRAIEKLASPLAKLRGMVIDFADRPSITPGGCPLLNTAIDSDDGNPALRAHARTALRGWIARLEELLREGMDAGEIRKDIDPPAIASLLISTLEGSIMMSRLLANHSPLQSACQQLEKVLDEIAVSSH